MFYLFLAPVRLLMQRELGSVVTLVRARSVAALIGSLPVMGLVHRLASAADAADTLPLDTPASIDSCRPRFPALYFFPSIRIRNAGSASGSASGATSSAWSAARYLVSLGGRLSASPGAHLLPHARF